MNIRTVFVMIFILVVSLLLMSGCEESDRKEKERGEEEIERKPIKKEKKEKDSEVVDMKIESEVFRNREEIPSKYTCDGRDINPPLRISGVPEEVESLVLIMDDPDAVEPAGQVWDHWVVFNIPPSTTTIEEGREPEGVHGKGTSGNYDYKGPCPPDREHTYHFKLYALNSKLDLKRGVSKEEVESEMKGKIVGEAELIGLYERE